MATRLGDWPVEELPCVQVDMSLLLIMAGQFCPGYSSSIFSQATPYISISISSLVQALSANLLQTFSETREKKRERERGGRGESDREQSWGAAGFSLQSCFRFPQGVWMQIQIEKCPKVMLWLRYLPHELHTPMLPEDWTLRVLPLLCLLYCQRLICS